MPGDLGSFPLVGGGEGLVEQDKAAGPDAVDDWLALASSSSSLPLVMRGVLLAPVVGEHAAAQGRAVKDSAATTSRTAS